MLAVLPYSSIPVSLLSDFDYPRSGEKWCMHCYVSPYLSFLQCYNAIPYTTKNSRIWRSDARRCANTALWLEAVIRDAGYRKWGKIKNRRMWEKMQCRASSKSVGARSCLDRVYCRCFVLWWSRPGRLVSLALCELNANVWKMMSQCWSTLWWPIRSALVRFAPQ